MIAQKKFSDLDSIASAIEVFSNTRTLSVISISGFGGSGKSTLCCALSAHFAERAFHFECDLFAKYGTVERRARIANALESGDLACIEREENPKNWYGWDDIAKTLEGLRQNGAHTFANGWNQVTGDKDKVAYFKRPNHDHAIILVDCIYLLHTPVIDWFDLSIFVDTSLETTFARSEARDQHRSDPSYLAYKQGLTRKYDVPYFEKNAKNADWVYRLKP